MDKIKITQNKSLIGCIKKKHGRTMQALGFGSKGKINKSVEKNLNPQIQGMLDKIGHLVVIEKI